MATLNKLFALLNKEGLTEQRAGIIFNFTDGRTSSAKELTPAELDEMCDVLLKARLNQMDELDKKRKRCIGAQFAVFELMNKQVTMQYVIGTICRRAKVENINHISSGKLDNIYNSLLDAQKQLKISGRLVNAHLLESKSYN